MVKIPTNHPCNFGVRDETPSGSLDLAGFRKDLYYLYQARWRPEIPLAHILPHWNWPERVGQVTPVHVYTSGDTAELFLNGLALVVVRANPGQAGEIMLKADSPGLKSAAIKLCANGRATISTK